MLHAYSTSVAFIRRYMLDSEGIGWFCAVAMGYLWLFIPVLTKRNINAPVWGETTDIFWFIAINWP